EPEVRRSAPRRREGEPRRQQGPQEMRAPALLFAAALIASLLLSSACGSQTQRPAAGCVGPARPHAAARAGAGIPAFTHPTRYPIAHASGDGYSPVGRAVRLAHLNPQ